MTRGIALTWLAVLAPAALPQDDAGADSVIENAFSTHLACVANERRELVLSEYAAAGPEARLRLEKTFERLRQPGAGAIAPPPLDVVARARRALAHAESPAELERLERLVDSLDLLPSPGLLDASAETSSEAAEQPRSRVLVYPLYPVTDRVGFELSLLWIAPSGEERTAGSRTVTVFDLQQPGFELELEPPAGPPGVWQLVPRVTRADLSTRGFPVIVERIAGLTEPLRQVLSEASPSETPRGLFGRSLALRSQRGLRTLVGILPSQELRQFSSGSSVGGTSAGESALEHATEPAPLEVGFADESGAQHWIWGFQPAPKREIAIVLLAPAHESPEAALFRPEWQRVARELSAELFSLTLPGDPRTVASVVPMLERLRARANARRTIVVARGEAIASLQWGLEGRSEYPFDGLVLCTALEPAAPRDFLARVPRLLVAPGGDAELPAEPGAFTWVDGSTTLLLSEPRLPQLLARWIATCDAVRPDER